MKKSILPLAILFTILISIIGCASDENNKTENKDSTVKNTPKNNKKHSAMLPVSYYSIKDLQNNEKIVEQSWSGYYTGSFGKNKLTIQLRGTYGDSLYGYSICAGNFSQLRGKMEGNKAILYEEKDGDHNGVFGLTISGNTLDGKWIPYSSKADLTKAFLLEKRDYKYDIHAGKYAIASQRELKKEEVSNLLPEDLRIMINEIYARYGYCFYKKDVRYYFESQDWYMPTTTYVGEKITELEWKNINMITDYIKYYDESLDSFGR